MTSLIENKIKLIKSVITLAYKDDHDEVIHSFIIIHSALFQLKYSKCSTSSKDKRWEQLMKISYCLNQYIIGPDILIVFHFSCTCFHLLEPAVNKCLDRQRWSLYCLLIGVHPTSVLLIAIFSLCGNDIGDIDIGDHLLI